MPNRRLTATYKEALQFLSLAKDDDNSPAVRYARFGLDMKTMNDALYGKVEELIKRCDECERGTQKLATQMTQRVTSLQNEHKKEVATLKEQRTQDLEKLKEELRSERQVAIDKLNGEIAALNAKVETINARNNTIEQAYAEMPGAEKRAATRKKQKKGKR